MTAMTKLNRAQGALLGLAAGDAVGTTLEFTERRHDPTEFVTDMVGGGPFRLAPGEWTDDTSMALALADSLVANEGAVDASDLLARFARWRDEGAYSHNGRCFDIGNQTTNGIQLFLDKGSLVNGTQKHRQANGGIMRLAPAAIVARTQTEAVKISRLQSQTTHGSDHCLEFAGDLGKLLFQLIEGNTEALDRYRDFHWVTCPRESVVSSGHALATFRAALWAVCGTASFRDAIIAAINLGDDADTVGAVTGQIAGALYGRDGIPADWLAKLAWRERIEKYATDLYLLRGRGQQQAVA